MYVHIHSYKIYKTLNIWICTLMYVYGLYAYKQILTIKNKGKISSAFSGC